MNTLDDLLNKLDHLRDSVECGEMNNIQIVQEIDKLISIYEDSF